VEKTFGTALLGSIGVRHVGIARGMPDDMNTNDPFKTSEGFAFICVLNFKCSKIFSSASELRVLALRGPKPLAKMEKTQSNRVPVGLLHV
jgi:hypothetical protein